MTLACTLCEQNRGIRLMDHKLNLHRCPDCDHTFSIKGEGEKETYEEAYYLDRHPNWFANPNVGLFRFIHQKILGLSKEKSLTLLDVGCGNGDFLKYLAEQDSFIELEGIDSSALRHEKVKFIQGDFYEYGFNKKYDVICNLMVIEHVDNPTGFVDKMTSLLKPGGILVTTTNNNHCLLYVIARVLRHLGIRVAFDRVYSHHHLQHFSNQSLKVILERFGFEVLYFRNHNYPLKAVDIPPGPWLIKKIYLLLVAIIFLLSNLFRNGFLQTYICRKR
jgi:SAM-dependent methyltransferase